MAFNLSLCSMKRTGVHRRSTTIWQNPFISLLCWLFKVWLTISLLTINSQCMYYVGNACDLTVGKALNRSNEITGGPRFVWLVTESE